MYIKIIPFFENQFVFYPFYNVKYNSVFLHHINDDLVSCILYRHWRKGFGERFIFIFGGGADWCKSLKFSRFAMFSSLIIIEFYLLFCRTLIDYCKYTGLFVVNLTRLTITIRWFSFSRWYVTDKRQNEQIGIGREHKF